MRISIILSLIVTGFITSFDSLAFADDRIRIHYNERPPYLRTVYEGVVVGLTADPSRRAFQEAGIPHYWQKTPAKRQMRILEENQGRDCLVGWFKNPQREVFARYSLPIYEDKPTIGLALFSNEAIESKNTLSNTFKDTGLVLLTKDGYSYGKYIDNMIFEQKPKQVTVTTENSSMLMMLNVGRADYIFMAEEEAEELILSESLIRSDYKFIRFTDMPAGNKRYILCSMQVEERVIHRLNTWIEQNVNLN